MPTYTTTADETIRYPEQPPEVAAFVARAAAAAADPAVTVDEFLALIYGEENPILDRSVNPRLPMVTSAVYRNPVFRVLTDMVGHKQIAAGEATKADFDAPYTVTVAEAARQLGVSESTARAAAKSGRLSGRFIRGQWYTRPEAIAGFRVSTRGRKPAAPRPVPAADRVAVVAGSEPGASLAIRVTGAEWTPAKGKGRRVTGDLPAGWTQATVRTTGTDKRPRVFVIEPAAGESETIGVGGLSVTGAFKIVRKVNSVEKATAAWAATPR